MSTLHDGGRTRIANTAVLAAHIQGGVERGADNVPIAITDLAVQPGTNTLYGTLLSEEDFVNSIYTINPTTVLRLSSGARAS